MMSHDNNDIIKMEESLRLAQLKSDVAALDKLIADDLQFVFYNGQVFSKQMDLDAHRSGMIRFSEIKFSDQRINRLDKLALVTVEARLSGTLLGKPFDDHCRYLRVWLLRDGRWQIVGGSVSQIPGI